jgi:hypothetical protein
MKVSTKFTKKAGRKSQKSNTGTDANVGGADAGQEGWCAPISAQGFAC